METKKKDWMFEDSFVCFRCTSFLFFFFLSFSLRLRALFSSLSGCVFVYDVSLKLSTLHTCCLTNLCLFYSSVSTIPSVCSLLLSLSFIVASLSSLLITPFPSPSSSLTSSCASSYQRRWLRSQTTSLENGVFPRWWDACRHTSV